MQQIFKKKPIRLGLGGLQSKVSEASASAFGKGRTLGSGQCRPIMAHINMQLICNCKYKYVRIYIYTYTSICIHIYMYIYLSLQVPWTLECGGYVIAQTGAASHLNIKESRATLRMDWASCWEGVPHLPKKPQEGPQAPKRFLKEPRGPPGGVLMGPPLGFGAPNCSKGFGPPAEIIISAPY